MHVLEYNNALGIALNTFITFLQKPVDYLNF